jgi:hypothetical protein
LGILTNIVAAEEDECAAIGESLRPVDRWSGIERRGIDTARIAMLHCLLTGEEFEAAVGAYEPVYAADEGAVVLRIADEAMERLAALDEEALALVGEELAATAEYEIEGWDVEEVQALVIELGDLARLAESQDQVMFVWIHPLLT